MRTLMRNANTIAEANRKDKDGDFFCTASGVPPFWHCASQQDKICVECRQPVVSSDKVGRWKLRLHVIHEQPTIDDLIIT